MGLNVKKGKISEFQFVVESLRLGYSISQPLDEANSYDFIVDNNKNLLKVQVRSVFKLKKIYSKRDKIYSSRYSFNLPKSTNIDILALYIEPLNKWYLIPRAEIKASTICFNPSEKSTGSKYDKYQDNWKILGG